MELRNGCGVCAATMTSAHFLFTIHESQFFGKMVYNCEGTNTDFQEIAPKREHVTKGEEQNMAGSQEKWEYCRMEDLLGGSFVPAKLIFFTAEGETVEILHAEEDSTQKKVVAMRIAQLGDEGWEMAGMGITGQGSHAVYFKRRKS
jgi:hypothetical protein